MTKYPRPYFNFEKRETGKYQYIATVLDKPLLDKFGRPKLFKTKAAALEAAHQVGYQ